MMFKSDLPPRVFRDRLRTYLFGVAIGLILMGFVMYSANLYRQQRRAEIEGDRASQEPAPPPAPQPATPAPDSP